MEDDLESAIVSSHLLSNYGGGLARDILTAWCEHSRISSQERGMGDAADKQFQWYGTFRGWCSWQCGLESRAMSVGLRRVASHHQLLTLFKAWSYAAHMWKAEEHCRRGRGAKAIKVRGKHLLT